MLKHPTLDQLHALGLQGMAKAFIEIAASGDADALGHHERDSGDREVDEKDRAPVEAVDQQPAEDRGDRGLLRARQAQCVGEMLEKTALSMPVFVAGPCARAAGGRGGRRRIGRGDQCRGLGLRRRAQHRAGATGKESKNKVSFHLIGVLILILSVPITGCAQCLMTVPFGKRLHAAGS